MTITNHRQVKDLVKRLDGKLRVGRGYLQALDQVVENHVRKHVFIIRGRKTLTHHEVDCAWFYSSPSTQWKGRTGKSPFARPPMPMRRTRWLSREEEEREEGRRQRAATMHRTRPSKKRRTREKKTVRRRTR